MSPAPALSQLWLEELDQANQRLCRRYPIALDVQYRSSRGRGVRRGLGTTVNVSSRGVLFQSDDPLPAGSPVELTMSWPFLLEGVCPLKLVMRGRVVRSDSRGIAVRASEHEFRVAGAAAPRPQPSGEQRSA
jgi:hypothetical protein